MLSIREMRPGWRRMLTGVLAIFIAMLTLASTGTAVAQTPDAPVPPGSGNAALPTIIPPESQAVLVISAEDTVYDTTQQDGPGMGEGQIIIEGAPAATTAQDEPLEPIQPKFNTFCTATSNSRVVNTQHFSSAWHCTEKETNLTQEVKYECVRMTLEQLEERAKAKAASTPPTTAPPGTPPAGTPAGDPTVPRKGGPSPDYRTAQDRCEKVDPQVELHLYQPVRVPNRCITIPTLVGQVNARSLESGNDFITIQLDLVDPDCNIPVVTLADTPPPVGTEVQAVGYAGSTMRDALAYMYPQQRDDKKTLLDFLREDSVITPTVTSGTINGTKSVGSSSVTQTNSDMTGGMSGGALIANGQQVGIVTGGFGGGGGAFNFVSSNLQLMRMDMRNAGADIPLSQGELRALSKNMHAAQQLEAANGGQALNDGFRFGNNLATWATVISVLSAIIALVAIAVAIAAGRRNRGRQPERVEEPAVR